MRKILLIATSLVVASTVAAAQRHLNSHEIPVKGKITVASNVMLGSTMLKEGEYNYRCDREHITFVNPATGKIVVRLPCEGREMPEPAKETTMHMKADAYGTKVVTKLLLKGSNIEHVFR